MGARVKPESLNTMKQMGQRIVVITCYDYPTARLQDAAGVDVIFVGDSVGQNVLGYEGPRNVTMADMLHHTRAVRRGVISALLMADLPFGSYDNPDKALENAMRLREAGAEVVKLEGGREMRLQIERLVSEGIPVVGHIGHTPQTRAGERPLYGSQAEEAFSILEDALYLEAAGVSGVVIECVPERVAEEVTKRISIPTIGIGAGRVCDGQVLVVNDLLGLNGDLFRFVKQYANLREDMQKAFQNYSSEVREGIFPGNEHRFLMKKEALQDFREKVKKMGVVARG
ncbi:MAG: 3-methyl-2-oxobutanoate hydroxymethyltransferase [bacterium]|nr:3-methyl-2-oxobutanoate hydroxymethyltransferase [bacterium]